MPEGDDEPSSEVDETHRPTTVAVCICTCRRPGRLEQLLTQLLVVAERAEQIATVGVVVVDDDPAGGAADVARRFADRFALGLVYRHTGSGNISLARNTALETGATFAAWLAMIDDDCEPVDEWLVGLLDVQQRTGADAVTGACRTTPPSGAPAWLTDQPFLMEMSDDRDGEQPAYGATKNTLISSRWLGDHPDIRFDQRLGRLGGEDMVFFYRALGAGLRHRYSSQGGVSEIVPTGRTTFKYNLRTRYWFGNSEYVTNIEAGRSTRSRLVMRGSRRLLLAVARPVRRLLHRQRPQWRWTLAEIAAAVGLLVGAVGVRVNHH